MASPQAFPHDPRILAKAVFDESKLYWSLALLLKVVAAGLGIYFALSRFSGVLAPWALAIIAAAAECCQWRSDILKGRAEQLKRKIEFYDGMGWPLSPADLSDTLANLSRRRRSTILAAVKENYFASKRETGPTRALENLQESSWWSKNLAGPMLILCGIVTSILVVGSLISLGLSVGATKDLGTLENVSRVIGAVISLIVSLGLIKLMNGYYAFARRSEQIEKAATALLSGNASELDAIKLLHDYQIARAAAPFIPDWIWKARRDTLNELWAQYRRGA